jgi:hypothetical protein
METPTAGDVERVRRALKRNPVAWRVAARGGQTAAARWHVSLEDGSRAFVKIGATLDTAAWIRDEHLVYARLRGAPFMPRLLGWFDDPDEDRPVLAVDDLSDAHWPPPWEPGHVQAVLATLRLVHDTPPPPDVARIDQRKIGLDGSWREIEADPGPFLRLGLCPPRWLERCLPELRDAATAADVHGDRLLHLDVRSDNLCLREGTAILVDWNWACVGDPVFEVAAWLPSLHAEGGPAPEEVLPAETPGLDAFAALLAGFFCLHAGKPPIPEAPHVRPLQLAQARTALPWAARALGLPAPG